MTSWSARTKDGSHSLIVDADALREIDSICSAAGDIETGGVLIGRYSANGTTATILEATAPPSDSQQGHTWFNRGSAGLRKTLQQRWRNKERSYYIGEWHFHPAAHVVPSADDFSQMAQIANANQYKCREPLLLIFGAAKNQSGQRVVRAFVCPAGDLPIELIGTDV